MKCSLAHSDNMRVAYHVQELLPTKRDTITETFDHMTIDRCPFFSNGGGLAQAKSQTYRRRTALYGRTVISPANREPVVLVATLP